MPDKTECIDNSYIQHGNASDRIYLMKLGQNADQGLLDKLRALAIENSYGKIIAKVPVDKVSLFTKNGYIKEAHVPGYFAGKAACCFMALYLDPRRALSTNTFELDEVMNKAKSAKAFDKTKVLPENAIIRKLSPDDAEDMAALFRQVFSSYPFPIFKPGYLQKTMADNILYYGLITDGSLAAVASCETDPEQCNCEMTDFAVLPDHRGKGYALALLSEMEVSMHKKGYKTLYTIARASSVGMNVVFSKTGYTYGGRLTNNTQISSRIETMNIWYKRL